MQKQKRDGWYVLLMLLAIVGIVYIMAGKEEARQKILASERSQTFTTTLLQLGECAYDRIFVNGHLLAGDMPGDVIINEKIRSGKFIIYSEQTETVMQQPPYTVGVTDAAYFNDALFIGDSRTVGIAEYGYLENADFFADVSMSVYKVWNRKISIDGGAKKTLENILEENRYGKVYIMLGINELGYDFEQNLKRYEELVAAVHEAQPEAVIYICANLHVTKEQSQLDEYFNNVNINRFNEAIAGLADDEVSFYIDINPMFDDEEGNLSEEFSSDGAHVMGIYYEDWCDWLMTQAIVKNS